MVYVRLISHIKRMVKIYNENTHSYDSHFDDYALENKIKDPNE